MIRLIFNEFADEEPDWSPDGLNILFSRRFDRQFSLWTLNLESMEEFRVTPPEIKVSRAHWSPNGKLIVTQHYPD
ncbi:TolB family protein [Aquiflexum balticum]|uniref:TolB family protein n=1 Tax=Aquiflexum balticum TaxID=280473 RepID=UPI001560E990|nr:PD40 domain-containing protein [Aquiflexum balticum]